MEPELAELDLPPNYGLPSPPPTDALVAFYINAFAALYRTTLALAYLRFKKGGFDDAIQEATRIIDEEKLRQSPQYVMILAAAYYVRGLAHERKGDRATARFNFQRALDLSPNYGLAARAFDRVKF